MKFKVEGTPKRKKALAPDIIDQLEAIWKIIDDLPVPDEKTKRVKEQVVSQLEASLIANKKAKRILIDGKPYRHLDRKE